MMTVHNCCKVGMFLSVTLLGPGKGERFDDWFGSPPQNPNFRLGPTLAALVPGRFQPVWLSGCMEMVCRREDGSTQDKELGILDLQVLQEAKRTAV